MKKRPLSLLMAQAQLGDNTAYEQLLEQSYTLVQHFVEKRLHDKREVLDVTQEIMLTLHKARHTYIPGKPYLPWMYTIARNKLFDYLRKHMRKADQEVEDEDIIDGLTQMDVSKIELSDVITDALQHLPNTTRDIVTQLKINGFKVQEIADQMNMTVSAVKTAASRGYKRMKHHIEKQHPDWV